MVIPAPEPGFLPQELSPIHPLDHAISPPSAVLSNFGKALALASGGGRAGPCAERALCYSQDRNTSTTEVADPGMKIYLGAPRGYCAGVVRAIDVVDIALKRYGPPIYVKHEIVHNSHVVNALALKGALTVDDVDDVPEGSTVVFSAHGSPPDDFRRAEKRGLKVIDATCPLVTKVHNEAHKYARDGRKLMLIGHKGHQEVIGSMGQEPMTLVDDRGDMDLPDWDDDDSRYRALTDHPVCRRYPESGRGNQGPLQQRRRAKRPLLCDDEPAGIRKGDVPARPAHPGDRVSQELQLQQASGRSQKPAAWRPT